MDTTRNVRRAVAEVERVEAILAEFVARVGRLDDGTRAMLPARRLIEARCPDLGLVYHARWDGGQLGAVAKGAVDRADIRVSVQSDDLVAMDAGELGLRRAYTTGRIRVDASMTDLLRLRTVL